MKKTNVLAHLQPTEAEAVLRSLLESHPELKKEVEEIATSLINETSFEAIADEVRYSVEEPDLDDLNSRGGHHPGGFVDPGDAAHEILREAIEPTIQEMRRQIDLGLERAALETCKGLILGLYGVRATKSNGCLAWAPDFPRDTAEEILGEWVGDRKETGKKRTFPSSFIDGHVPEWRCLLDRIIGG